MRFSNEERDLWQVMSQYLVGALKDKHQLFIQYINQSFDYLDQVESNDAIVRLTSTRRKRNEIDERVHHFPFTFEKVSNARLRKMRRDHEAKMKYVRKQKAEKQRIL